MAVPFRKVSKTRKRMRRTHFKLRIPGMVRCDHCGEYKRSHHVCPHCGHYKGEEVVEKD